MKAPSSLVKRLGYLVLSICLLSCLTLAFGLKWSSIFSWRASTTNTSQAPIASGAAKATAPSEPVTRSETSSTGLPEARQANPKAREDEERRGDQPDEAAEFYRLKRTPQGERGVPMERYATALKQMQIMPQYSTAREQEYPSRAQLGAEFSPAALGTWTPLGPGNIGGRTRALVIQSSNPSIIYAGGVAGGVWKTTNGGASWTPIADLIANIAVNSLAMDPTNSNVLYAGTGEGVFNGDAARGAGIFKTTNAGATWTQLASTNNSDFYFVNDLVISPINSQRVYAATRSGVWRSLDGGATWTQVLNPAVTGGCLDLAARTDQGTDYVFASCGTFAQATIYRNTDAGGGGTWNAVYTETGMGRTSLAISPSNQNIIYAAAASIASGNFNNGLQAIFRSTSSGDPGTWTAQVRNTSPTKLNTALFSNARELFAPECTGGTAAFFNQGWYDNVIAVDPVDSNRVWVGGVDVFRSDDGGANWGLASYWDSSGGRLDYAHADQHTLVFHPQYNGTTNQTLFVGNDGGIFRSDNARATTATGTTAACRTAGNASAVRWTALNNNYGVTQFYHGLPYPSGDTYFGGTQDNGTVRGTNAGGPNAWQTLLGGDGGYVAIDPTNPNVIYAEFQNFDFRKSTNGGASFSAAKVGIGTDNFLFITPFLMDPTNPQRLWVGGRMMWRTDNGAGTWAQASQQLTNANISAIAVSPTNPDLVLAGSSSGRISRTTTGTTATSSTVWTFHQTPRGTSGAYISWLAFDPTNANIAYATVSTFNGTGTDVGHVFRSTDGGQTWTSIDGTGATGIPDIPAHSIVVDPSNSAKLYVGTDLGVFTSTNTGTTWAVENTGFANVVTEALAVNTAGGNNKIFAFTHGRGAWSVGNASQAGFLYVLKVNTTGNQIFAFSVNETTGGLTAVPGFPVSTGGNGLLNTDSEQLTIDRTNLRLYAINRASGTVSAFSINSSTGALTPMPFSPINIGAGNWDAIAVHPSGSPLVVARGSSAQLASFQITATTATPAAGSPYSTGSAQGFSIAFSQDGNFVYTGGNLNTTIAGFSVNAGAGVLTPLPGSPFLSGNTSPLAYATDGAGRLFVTNSQAGQVRVFTTPGGAPTPVAGNPFPSGLTTGVHGLLHPNGFYMVADRDLNAVGVYQIAGSGSATTLTPVVGSPFPTSITADLTEVIALNQAGTFLFAANGITRNLSTFSVNTGTGFLSFLGTQPNDTLGTAGLLTGMAYVSLSGGGGPVCPTITLSPASLPNGSVGTFYNQTITPSPAGGYFYTVLGSIPPGLSFNFSAAPAPSISITGTPTTAGTFNFTVGALDASGCIGSQAYSITITTNCPSVTSITPTSGQVGNQVTISGSGFTGVTSVKFSNNVSASFTVLNDTTITTNVPAGAVTGPITLSKPGCGDTQTATFTVTSCPSVTLITPTSGSVGSQVTISGSGFTGVNSVKFSNNVSAGFSVLNDTTITTTVPAGAVTGPITLSKPGCGDTQTGTFTVTSCPTVTGISPLSGQSGTPVTISGSGFTGVNSVKFSNNVSAGFTVLNDSTITTTVPAGAVTGPITLSKSGCGDTQTGTFTVTVINNCVAVAISTSLTGASGGTLIVPISVGDLTGKGVTAYDFALTFDSNVIKPASTPTDTAGTLSSSFTITPNTAVNGRISVSAFGTAPLTGAGTLLNLRFDVIGATNMCSDLIWLNFTFNEGTPCATTSNGRACVAGGSISGTVNYGTSVIPKAVPGVTLTAAGTPSATSTTDASGNYSLTNLGGGPYTVTPSKTGAVNGISSLDASVVAQSAAGLVTLTPNQMIAADASGNGLVTSFDASLIAQTAAGIPNTGIAGTWKFAPSSRNYPTLSGNLTGQNFDAILVGDVTGNWIPAIPPPPEAQAAASRALVLTETDPVSKELPTQVMPRAVAAASGASVTVPIAVSELTGLKVTAYDLTLSFDPNVLQLSSTPVEVGGTLSDGLSVVVNTLIPGKVTISAFGTAALSGAGTLLNLKFEVIGAAGSSSVLSWEAGAFNEGSVNLRLVNSSVTVSTREEIQPELRPLRRRGGQTSSNFNRQRDDFLLPKATQTFR